MTRAATASSPGTRRTALGERLRRETRGAHLAAEAAFDLGERLSSIRRYREALLLLDAFHRGCAPALAAGAPRLPAQLRDGPARRRARLCDDLGRLGLGAHRLPAFAGAGAAIDEDRALGVWYVHEGAALGGLMIAAEVRRRLPQAIAAATFFAGEGKATAARWRAFQGALDEPDRDGAAERVLAGAQATFAMLTAALKDGSL